MAAGSASDLIRCVSLEQLSRLSSGVESPILREHTLINRLMDIEPETYACATKYGGLPVV
jgi:hypothetical protein